MMNPILTASHEKYQRVSKRGAGVISKITPKVGERSGLAGEIILIEQRPFLRSGDEGARNRASGMSARSEKSIEKRVWLRAICVMRAKGCQLGNTPLRI